VFDFENGKIVQSFPGLYGYLCDCIKFVDCIEIPAENNEFYLITRGVESEAQDENGNTVIAKPNSCTFWKLTLDMDTTVDPFELDVLNSFEDQHYHSNMWLVKVSTNGRYILAPGSDGKIFIWNLKSNEKVAVIDTKGGSVVREIMFHPSRNLMFACAEDSFIHVYEQEESMRDKLKKQQDQGTEKKKLKSPNI